MQSKCFYPKKQEPKVQNPQWGAVFQETDLDRDVRNYNLRGGIQGKPQTKSINSLTPRDRQGRSVQAGTKPRNRKREHCNLRGPGRARTENLADLPEDMAKRPSYRTPASCVGKEGNRKHIIPMQRVDKRQPSSTKTKHLAP